MSAISRLFISLFAVALAGCATIVSDDDYAVSMNSDPEGASFVVTNRAGLEVQAGVTPQVVQLAAGAGYFKGESYTVTVVKEGYEEQTFTIRSSMDGWYWGNLLIGGLIGMLIVDPITGAMYKLPDRVDISLNSAVTQEGDNGKSGIVFASIDDLTAEQRSRLERIE